MSKGKMEKEKKKLEKKFCGRKYYWWVNINSMTRLINYKSEKKRKEIRNAAVYVKSREAVLNVIPQY